MRLPHGAKKPEWSWFPGLVRHKDVWHTSRAAEQNNQNLISLIEDSLPLWNQHTLDTLLGFFVQNTMDREISTGAISTNLRKRVSDGISSVPWLKKEKRDALMGLLDEVPTRKQPPRPPVDNEEKFEWPVSEFITPIEDTILRNCFHKELEVNKDTLRFRDPFSKKNEHVGNHWPVDMKYMKFQGNVFQTKIQGTVSFGYPPTWWWDMIVWYKKRFYRTAVNS
jgi:hypothetical protein